MPKSNVIDFNAYFYKQVRQELISIARELNEGKLKDGICELIDAMEGL